jgi:tetratricopeptide (TPR) repeat protein
MRANRIWIAIGVVLIASAYYEARLKPQSRPLYESALALYKVENYTASLIQLEQAYQIEPNSTSILVLMGWNQLKLRQLEGARENFSRAARLDPTLVEAKLGLAYLSIETGGGPVQVEEIRSLLAQDPGNKEIQLAAAVLLRQGGSNLEAAELFRGLLGRDRYGALARQNLEEMYGLEQLAEEIPAGLPPLGRPSALRVQFRAADQYLERFNEGRWAKLYARGINIGPANPGLFPAGAPTLVEEYLQWLSRIADLGANTIRVYTVLPPAFYRALSLHNQNPNLQPLYLFQEVWLVGPEETNLFLPAVEEESRREIARAIDVIHGQGDLPMRRGYASGLYTVDVSDYVVGILIGREFEPHLVLANDEVNANQQSYTGRFLSIPEGGATEVWLTKMLDYAASYEVGKYNEQRPLAIVNWLPLDPLSHPTESGRQDVIRLRQRMGQVQPYVPPLRVGDDEVTVDETRIRVEGDFPAGLFVSYHIYPYYPNFLLHETPLLRARDNIGPNSYFGYLKALKGHFSKMPVLVAEYGIPTSIGNSHFHPYGWNHGGLNERQQGEVLARMTSNIADAGYAGGLVFEWQDEWWKANWLTMDLEIPADRRPFWQNVLNPEENFGLWTYDTSQSRLFSPVSSAWRDVKPLYQKQDAAPVVLNDGADAQRTLRSLSVSSDEAFVYVRLQVGSLARGSDGTPQLDKANYVIGISTRPGSFGSRILPGFQPPVRYPEGVNFLLHIAGAGRTRLLVASNYNAYGLQPIAGVPAWTELSLRVPWEPRLEDWNPFEELTVETNSLWFARDGRMFAPQRYSRSLLRYGPLDPRAANYDSIATWSADFQENALIFRLPWALLYVTDPSTRQVYAGADVDGQFLSIGTKEFALFALSFPPGASVPRWNEFPSTPLVATDSLPALSAEGVLTNVQTYPWKQWESIKLFGRLKSGAEMLRKSFQDLKGRGL